MECKEVCNRFSSLLEGDLTPSEEERIKEHLVFCQGCQKEWEQFNKMMGWLHAVEEEEVPEGFLSEIEKIRKERSREGAPRWSRILRSVKIPIQAAAMVMIVFLALYLTKMAPFEMLQKKTGERPDITESGREKETPILKEEEGSKMVSPPLALYRKDSASKDKPSAHEEKVSAQESTVQKMKEEDQRPAHKGEVTMARPKELAKAETPRLEEKKRESISFGPVQMPLAKSKVREKGLRVTDRERAIAQILELAKQVGGEAIQEERGTLLASLPISSLAEFEKELAKIGLPSSAPQSTPPRELKDDLSSTYQTKGEASVSIRIHLEFF